MNDEYPSELWENLTTKILVQEKPEWVIPHRAAYSYRYHEIPDDEDYKMFDW